MVLDDLGTFLQTAGLGTLGTSLFLGSIPQDAPLVTIQDTLMALIEVPGMGPVRTHDTARYEQPVIQVLAHAAPHAYAAARQHADTAWMLLDGIGNQVVGTQFYLWIQAIQSPFLLHLDSLARPVIIFNIRCARAL